MNKHSAMTKKRMLKQQ